MTVLTGVVESARRSAMRASRRISSQATPMASPMTIHFTTRPDIHVELYKRGSREPVTCGNPYAVGTAGFEPTTP